MSGRDESSLSAPRMIFTSGNAAGEHEGGFAVAGAWSPRRYGCTFCGREFNSAQALGGHMNIHRRDRARLRTSTSLSSVPHHADLPPAPQETAKSGYSSLYIPFDAACRDNPASISSSVNTYPPPTITSATPTFKPLVMCSVAESPPLAPPSHDNNPAASFSVPFSDLVSFRIFGSTCSSSASSFSKIQDGSQSLVPNTAHHASSLVITPMLKSSSLKPAEALNVYAGAGQASAGQFRPDCGGIKGGGGYNIAPQRIQGSQAKGLHKRTRGTDLIEDKSAEHCCAERLSASVSSTENSNSLHTATGPRSCVRRTHDAHNDFKDLNCLDLELRLGLSAPAPAGNN